MTQLDPTILSDDGKFGYQSAGDIIDASGFDTVLSARGGGQTPSISKPVVMKWQAYHQTV